MRISDWSSDVCSSDLVRDYLILCCAVDAGEWRRDGGWSWIGGAYTRGGRLGDASLQPDTADRQIFHIYCLVDGCPDGRLSWQGGICPAGSRNHQYRSDGLRPAGLHLGYISDAPIYRRSDFHAARHWSGICNEPSARDSQIPFVVLRSEEHTSELQSLMRISYAVFCL